MRAAALACCSCSSCRCWCRPASSCRPGPSTGAGRAGTRPGWRPTPPSIPRPWCRSMPRGPGAGRVRSRSIPGSSSSPRVPPATTATRWSAGASAGARPAVRRNLRPPDGRWAGNEPDAAGRAARRRRRRPRSRRSRTRSRATPTPTAYVTWPGPNSNTFVAWLGREVPELRLTLPPTAIGKDFLGRPARGLDAQRHRPAALAWRAARRRGRRRGGPGGQPAGAGHRRRPASGSRSSCPAWASSAWASGARC